jgi:hypothetical protein
MNRLSSRAFLPLAMTFSFSLANCACGEDVGEGTEKMDAAILVDAGDLGSDAGIFDAGLMPDAGTPDSGPVPMDAGPMPMDAGHLPGLDSGADAGDAPRADAGDLDDDAGIFAMDSGLWLMDSGLPKADAGPPPPDAGPLADAGLMLDSGGLLADAASAILDSGQLSADANCDPVALNEAGEIPFAVQTQQDSHDGLDPLVASGTAEPGDVVTFTLRQYPDGGLGNVVAIGQVTVACNGSFEDTITTFPAAPNGQFIVGPYQLRTHSSLTGEDLYTVVTYTGL